MPATKPTKILTPPALKCDEHNVPDLGVRARCLLERRVVWNMLAILGAAGFKPKSVDGGDGDVPTTTPVAVMEELFSMDEGLLWFHKSGNERWVKVILGNDGWDCISDWGYAKGDPDGFNAAMESIDGEHYIL